MEMRVTRGNDRGEGKGGEGFGILVRGLVRYLIVALPCRLL